MTDIFFIKKHIFIQKLYDKIINLSNKFYKLIHAGKEADFRYYTYYKKKKLNIMKKINADLYIIFGPDPTCRILAMEKGIEKIVLNLHYVEKASELSDEISMNILSVSKFVMDRYFENSKYDKNISGKIL